MKNLKFVLLVVVLLAAIPAVFFAQIKRNTPTIQDQQEQVLEDKKKQRIKLRRELYQRVDRNHRPLITLLSNNYFIIIL